MATKVGYIGIGRIGKIIASNVLAGEYPLMVYDLQEEPLRELERLGAQVASSPKEVAEFADIIELSVVNDEQVENVVLGKDGVLEGARPGSIIAIHSTIEPETAVKIGEKAKEVGVGVVDAPISGGQEGGLDKTLLYMVGGDKELFDRCQPLFSTSGTTIVHMGPLGSGAAMRIVHHVILGLNRLAVDEGMKVAGALGLDPATVCEAVHGGEAQSHVTDRYLQKYRDMTTSGLYRIAGIALRIGYDHGIPLVGPALFQQLYLPTQEKLKNLSFAPRS